MSVSRVQTVSVQRPGGHVPSALGLEDQTKAICADAQAWLRTQPDARFDLVLLDPPYDLVTPAMEGEALFHGSCITADTAPTIRALADLAPRTLALMHGPAFAGDCTAALHGLADGYADLFSASVDAVVVR